MGRDQVAWGRRKTAEVAFSMFIYYIYNVHVEVSEERRCTCYYLSVYVFPTSELIVSQSLSESLNNVLKSC